MTAPRELATARWQMPVQWLREGGRGGVVADARAMAAMGCGAMGCGGGAEGGGVLCYLRLISRVRRGGRTCVCGMDMLRRYGAHVSVRETSGHSAIAVT